MLDKTPCNQFCNLNYSVNILRMVYSRTMRSAGHTAYMEGT